VNIQQARKRQKSWSADKQQQARLLLDNWNEGAARRDFQGADFEALKALYEEHARSRTLEPAGVH
jgi:hypothetical protein